MLHDPLLSHPPHELAFPLANPPALLRLHQFIHILPIRRQILALPLLRSKMDAREIRRRRCSALIVNINVLRRERVLRGDWRQTCVVLALTRPADTMREICTVP